ncbi:MAG TPA: hypothetical protein VF292_04200 [Rhodanobacteraceae bacterium]
MKALAGWVAVALLCGSPAVLAQQVLAAPSAPPPPKVGTALPPPGINDPGAKPQSVPLPSTGIPPSIAPAAREAEGHGDSTNVATRTDADGDVIQEHRRGGEVYSATIKPAHGVTQTYHYVSPNGSLMHDPALGPVSPVYYTLYKWDGARKPATANGGDGNATPPPPPPPPSSSGSSQQH